MEQLNLNTPSTRSRLCEGYCVCTWSSTECGRDRDSFDGDAQSVLIQQEVNEVVQKVSQSSFYGDAQSVLVQQEVNEVVQKVSQSSFYGDV